MKLFPALVCCIFIALFACGCAPALQSEKTHPELPGFAPADNPLLETAGEAILAARKAGFEWLIADPAAGDEPVTFRQLLDLAKVLLRRGETSPVEQIAERLIRLSNLALAQAREAEAAQPDYPSAD